MSLERQDTQRATPGESGPVGPPTPARLATGDEVGRYRVRRVLGQGGMGVVYLAEDPQLGRLVALKLLRPAVGAEGQEHQRRLLREAQVLARVAHPNLVTVYDVGVHASMVFVAMEYVRGQTLDAWQRERPRKCVETLRQFVDAGRGLIAVHDAGLVHRDFKPGNVMVASDGRVLLLDFGLARSTVRTPGRDDDDDAAAAPSDAADDDISPVDDALGADLTRAGGILGTPAYMAPEQHLALEADARADQFAFCVALYEALYGERPFRGRDSIELMEAALRGSREIPPAREDLPIEVRRALHRGLQGDRDQRFETMRELVDEVERAIAAAKPRRTMTLMIAAAALMVFTAAVTWRLAQDDTPAAVVGPDATTTTIDGPAEPSEGSTGSAAAAAESPDAAAASAGDDGATSLPNVLELPPPAGTSTGSAPDTSTGDAGDGGSTTTAIPPVDPSLPPVGASDGRLPGIGDADPLPPPPQDGDGDGDDGDDDAAQPDDGDAPAADPPDAPAEPSAAPQLG
jgi:predicted Ser/Thr protein kinase